MKKYCTQLTALLGLMINFGLGCSLFVDVVPQEDSGVIVNGDSGVPVMEDSGMMTADSGMMDSGMMTADSGMMDSGMMTADSGMMDSGMMTTDSGMMTADSGMNMMTDDAGTDSGVVLPLAVVESAEFVTSTERTLNGGIAHFDNTYSIKWSSSNAERCQVNNLSGSSNGELELVVPEYVGLYSYDIICFNADNERASVKIWAYWGEIVVNSNGSNWPDLGQATAILGDLYITETNLQNLDGLGGLSNINKLGGSLIVSENNFLTSLSNLDHLKQIDNTFYLHLNPILNQMNTLSDLKTIKYDLSFHKNALIPNLSGLTSLNNIGGDLIVSENSSLTFSTGLGALKNIGGDLQIYENPFMQNLSQLSSLEEIGKDLYIADNNILNNLGMNSLDKVEGGSFLIRKNQALLCSKAHDLYQQLTVKPASMTIRQNFNCQ